MSGISERNPFVGPRPIQRGERLYGREREIDELYNRVQARRIVVLHSPSGAGKSSLVMAGLLPRLEDGKFDVWRAIRVNLDPTGIEGIPPGTNRYLLSALVSLEDELPAERRRSPVELAKLDFLDYLEARPRRKNKLGQPVVLLFDQFEEILTVDPLAVAAKHEFFARVGRALDNERYWALFIVREDYLAAFDGYREYVPTQMSNTFRLELLGLPGAREAALRLAESGGRAFPAVDKLIGDLSTVRIQQSDGSFVARQGLHVEPVYLQVVCRRLWDAMPEDDLSIDPEDIEAYAGISESLAGYYADAVGSIAKGDVAVERAIRDWIGDKLIVGGIRSQVRQDAGSSAGLDNKLIEQLLDTYLVRSEQRAGANWFELSHDRLVEPIHADNERWEQGNLHPLQAQAKLWENGGRVRTLLLGADALPDAQAWAKANPTQLTGGEREFLELSLARRNDELRQRRRQRVFTGTVATIAAIALVLGGVAWRMRGVAESERVEAVEAKSAAETAKLNAEFAQAAAEVAQFAAQAAQLKAEQAQMKNERLVRELLRQMFQVGLRRFIEHLGQAGAHSGEVEVDEVWTPLLGRGGQVFAAANVLEGGGRLVVAGHAAVLSEVDEHGDSLFLEITIEWVLGDQAKRGIAIIPQRPGRYARLEDLRRNLSALDHHYVIDPPLVGLADDEQVGMLIIDNRWAQAFSPEELAAVATFVERGGGVLAVGNGAEWLARDVLDGEPPATLDAYPMNALLGEFGVRWTEQTLAAEDLEQEEEQASVLFNNESHATVNLLSRNAEGREEYYATLEHGEIVDLRTAIGGEWVVRVVADDHLLGSLVIESGRQIVAIGATVSSRKVAPKLKPEDGGGPPPTDEPPDQPASLPVTLANAVLAEQLEPAVDLAMECGMTHESLASSIRIEFVVAPSGEVTSASALAPMKGTSVGTCVASAVAATRFPESQEGVSKTWTFALGTEEPSPNPEQPLLDPEQAPLDSD
jgi:hypothetical protein